MGNGYLMYPVPGAEGDDKSQALSTIRLEAIRDGLEDYEYFLMLQQLIEQAKAGGTDDAAMAAEQLLDIPTYLFESPRKWKGADVPMRKYRDRLAQAIEALTQ